MKQTIQNHELIYKYNSLMEDMKLTIAKLTNGETVYFEENGFEDDSNNDLCAVSPNGVYDTDDMGAEPLYPLDELSFWDGIKIIEILQSVNVKQ